MQGEYQADHLLFDQLEVVYRQFLSLIESSESQPGIGKHQSKCREKMTLLCNYIYSKRYHEPSDVLPDPKALNHHDPSQFALLDEPFVFSSV
jgi:hypothetical protein